METSENLSFEKQRAALIKTFLQGLEKTNANLSTLNKNLENITS
ncbi:22380_t:CDS:2, partial [Entrophospora sp. SA101]